MYYNIFLKILSLIFLKIKILYKTNFKYQTTN